MCVCMCVCVCLCMYECLHVCGGGGGVRVLRLTNS